MQPPLAIRYYPGIWFRQRQFLMHLGLKEFPKVVLESRAVRASRAGRGCGQEQNLVKFG